MEESGAGDPPYGGKCCSVRVRVSGRGSSSGRREGRGRKEMYVRRERREQKTLGITIV